MSDSDVSKINQTEKSVLAHSFLFALLHRVFPMPH